MALTSARAAEPPRR
jgi:hypothetical protein